MTTKDKVARRKLSLLELASEFGPLDGSNAARFVLIDKVAQSA